ncbi:hypothetical protein A3G63_03005 [Candidatus Kaiserbacteria bacterium RIFCSPLOWO2_12_FULL_52_8]|uniref:Glycosidase n=1 Tax=Candidatus Kaiserbacteria bacterium RIFCSPHIGHO2_01_FULL_53_31 TaxID=1798481 RepID=A0A1F6CIL3_9BACT|nr:MAG: hypothetical protein A2678_01320 [Candidatus Kaiserbacteria bacterium RIFCSPHIGHO2_01_FULL_53_31]OGG94562.1 MAG: hypothetical protein A3G63_03005 [Candidatus Kaiserbacteria bacterium RIFCSPLOWO2_12_FULL_52_8]
MSALLLVYWFAILISFFVVGCMVGAFLYAPLREKIQEVARAIGRRDLSLARILGNPVIQPGRHPWRAEAVFNPAAVVQGGRTHLVYRSVGSDGVSRLGYASSPNGFVFDDQFPYPIYAAINPRTGEEERRYSPAMYPSGGSWGGCEDPRMVEIDGRIYITFNMFDSWDSIRITCTSISTKDFFSKRFHNLTSPQFLSGPGERHKNWVLFPEKIDGRFAILHSISPKIEIEYRDSIDNIGITEPFVESWNGARCDVHARDDYWDSFVRGAGPPPLRTPKGWLLFYHANDKLERHRYKLGAMLLDLDDPTNVLYRSSNPILEPDEQYENDGKPGIVFACGATIKDDLLYVYYGGADKVICVAFAPLADFLRALMKSEHAPLLSRPLSTA